MLEKDKNSRAEVNGIIAGAFSLTVAVIIIKIIGYIYKIPLSYILKDEGMGYFNAAYTVFTFFYLVCSAAVPRAVSILVAEKSVKGDEGAGLIFKYALMFFAVIGAISSAVILIFAPEISSWIGNSGSLNSLIAIAPSVFFVAIAGVARGYLNGRSRLVPIAISEVVGGVIKFTIGLALAIVGLKYFDLDSQSIAALVTLGVTLGACGSVVLLLASTKNNNTALKLKQKSDLGFKKVMSDIVRLATPMTLCAAVLGLTNVIDLALIMRRLAYAGLSEAEAGALYGNYTTLVVPMLNLVTALVSPISVAALPMITTSFMLNKKEELKGNIEFLFRACSFIAFPLALAFCIFPEEILMLLFSDSSAKIAAPLLVLISPSVIFVPFLTLANTASEATKHIKTPLFVMSLGCVIKLTVSYFLIAEPQIGIIGAPMGTSACYGFAMVASMLFAFKYTGVRLKVTSVFLIPALSSFVSVGSARLLYDWISRSSFSPIKFLICVAFSIIMYLLMSYLFGSNLSDITKKLSKSTKKT